MKRQVASRLLLSQEHIIAAYVRFWPVLPLQTVNADGAVCRGCA
jgi:hypothetical protein